MAIRKLYDLAVKTGEYQDNQGNTKGRWQNVGAVMQGDDGGKFIMLERWFNPAGLPNPDNRASILVSMFEPRQQGGQGGQRAAAPQRQRQQQAPADDFDDDIPF